MKEKKKQEKKGRNGIGNGGKEKRKGNKEMIEKVQ